jgi:UDP-N-acetylglucosamine 2-epimerase (non-hydrolysing)
MPRIHVFIGTKAQYVKTAPLLRLMDRRGTDYRLIDSGQHARIAGRMRGELGVRGPDHILGGEDDIETVPQALAWAGRLALRLGSARSLRRDVFGGARRGTCVVHGDTPTTLLSALMARRAGLEVAHLEAGLRSHDLLHPFPEELVRIAVMRIAHLLFAPDAEAVRNLTAMGLRHRVVPVEANTVVEAVAYALRAAPPRGDGPAIVTMHRVENLHRAERVRGFVELVERIASSYSVRFMVHGPTRPVLERHGLIDRLHAAGVELRSLAAHDDFVRMLHAAPLVVTDGGSIQEECALLGVPTMLWRARTERSDGIGRNVVLSDYDEATVERFVAEPRRWRHEPAGLDRRPSETILDVLLEESRG